MMGDKTGIEWTDATCKKRAGGVLDGRIWDEFPEAVASCRV